MTFDHIPLPPVSQTEVDALVSAAQKATVNNEKLKLALGLVDLTTLEGKDDDKRVETLCRKAVTSGVAAVCVYPTLVATAKKSLAGSKQQVASVAGAFPSGQLPLELRVKEAAYALVQGADEIDMVISRGRFINGDHTFLFEEVAAFKKVCGDKTLKVILETGELENLQQISDASRIALAAGADFIKTSTGKISVNATLPAVAVMLLAIRDQYKASGKKAGIKPSGGISEGAEAVKYMELAQLILGEAWLTPELFRFGASRLVDNLLAEMEGKKATGGNGY